MRSVEEHVRLALQSVRAMRPATAIDLDRQELAAEHLRAALRDLGPAGPHVPDRRDYVDTGQLHLTDCPGYSPHCDRERCNRCGHCGWTEVRHRNVQALRDCGGFLSSGAVCTVDLCATCGYVESVHRTPQPGACGNYTKGGGPGGRYCTTCGLPRGVHILAEQR